MINFIKLMLMITLIFSNDGEGPLFTNIMPISDFSYGENIQIDIQAIDSDGIQEVILYYKFDDNEEYSNINMKSEINYFVTIPGFEVQSNKLEYYFLGIDIFGNQRIFPEEGDENPLKLTMKGDPEKIIDEYEINLIEPLNNSKSQDISIIILSIYNQNKKDIGNRIEIILNEEDITNICNISNDLITYVPNKKLNEGIYELIFKITDGEETFIKKFNFESFKENIANQNINTYNWMNNINYSGNIDYSSDYDKFNYANNSSQPDTRPLDIHRLNLNLKLKYKQINVKIATLFNTHIIDENARFNKQYKQPIDRIKIGIKTPYINLNFGDYSTNFTDLTLKGTRVRGIHGLMKLGPLKLTYVRGKTKELIQSTHWEQQIINNPDVPGMTLNDSTFLYYNKGTPSRNLRSLRAELLIGRRINFGLTGLSSYDVQDVDIPYSELYSNYVFIGNALIGSDLTLFFNNKRTWISMESAISMTNDILDDNINNYITNLTSQQQEMLGGFENLIGFSITTDLLLGKDQGRGLSIPNPPVDDSLNVTINSDYLKNIIQDGTYKIKFKSPFYLGNLPCSINGEYKRIPFSFVSFGNSSIPKDIQGLTTKFQSAFFNNQLIINFGYNNDNDNVNGYKLTTINSLGHNIGIALNFDKMPSLNYSQRILNRTDNIESVNNTTITHTINGSSKFKINDRYAKTAQIAFSSNVVIMDYNDWASSINNNNFEQISISNSLSISTQKISISSGIGLSQNIPEDKNKSVTQFVALSSKISYKPKNTKLNSYMGFNKIIGKNESVDSTINNEKETLKLGLQYKFNTYSSMKYQFEYLTFSDIIEPNNNYSEFKGKLTIKISF